MVRIRLWVTLKLKPRETFATLSENPLSKGKDNQAALFCFIHFLFSLLAIQLAAIMNEISRVVIGGEGFSYSFSFP